MRYLRDWSAKREALAPLIDPSTTNDVPSKWSRPKVAGRDFLMPWNIAKEFWQLYDKPPAERPLYPFNAEPVEEFIKLYAGKRDVPIFDSKLVTPVIYINDMPTLLKDGPTTVQSVMALLPLAKSVKPPTGTVGVSKLPLATMLTALAEGRLAHTKVAQTAKILNGVFIIRSRVFG